MKEKQAIVPTVDLRDPKAAEQLSVICRDVGFFFLEGHGLPQTDIDEVFQQSKQLFSLPVDEKQELSDKLTNRGYTAMQEQTLNPAQQSEGDTKVLMPSSCFSAESFSYFFSPSVGLSPTFSSLHFF
jgi:isopenicillin N synthase-like dioxygenase